MIGAALDGMIASFELVVALVDPTVHSAVKGTGPVHTGAGGGLLQLPKGLETSHWVPDHRPEGPVIGSDTYGPAFGTQTALMGMAFGAVFAFAEGFHTPLEKSLELEN